MKELIKEVIDDSYLDMTIEDLVDEQPYEIKIRNNFNTACWAYTKDKHIIFIGDKILDKLGETENTEDLWHYIASYLYHEVGHSLYTERDLESVNLALKNYDIAFSLFNLCEDARIEYLMKQKAERLFKWSEYETLQKAMNASEMLFNIIQRDGFYEEDKEDEILEKVIEYYERFIKAQDSFEVVEILVEWKEDFPDTNQEMKDLQDKISDHKEDSSLDEPGPLEDLKHSMSLMMSEEALEEALSESEGIRELIAAEQSNRPEEVIINSVEVSECSSGNLLGRHEEWDVEKALKISKRLDALFIDKKGYVNSKRSSNRINKKAFKPGAHTNKLYRRKTTQKATNKEIIIILDVSGSMYGDPINNMKIVIGAFNELAKKRKISGRIILSGVRDRRCRYQTFNFPVDNEVIERFEAISQAEGIEHTMSQNIEHLRNADNVFVLTDGCINDAPIDKAKYHMENIYTVGIYIGHPDYANLNKWFDKGIATDTIEGCVSELLIHIKGY